MNASTFTLRSRASWIMAGALAVFLAACGGSGSDVIPDTITIQGFDGPTTVHAGDSVSERAIVVRTGNINNADLAYSWVQSSGIPVLNLAGTNTSTITFTAPPVTQDSAVLFKLTVTGRGHTEEKDLTLTVQP